MPTTIHEGVYEIRGGEHACSRCGRLLRMGDKAATDWGSSGCLVRVMCKDCYQLETETK